MESQFNLEPNLVHQILLTDPSDFESLAPGLKSPTKTFDEFQNLLLNSEDNPAYMLKRAYQSSVQQTIEETSDLQPLWQLLVELHTAVRALVPNRKDLHSFLTDDFEVPAVENALAVMPRIAKAAQALEKLESEARAESTRSWLHNASTATVGHNSNPISFMITSICYLIDKAEQCNQDKKDVYLTHVLAPRIRNTEEGSTLERKVLHDRFGDQPPITKGWIKQLVSSNNSTELQNNLQHRRDLIRRGWVEDILFQKEKEVVIPEIFVWDVPTLQAIRNTTRIAAAGCALGYFACMTAKVDPEILLKEEDKGKSLVHAMNSRKYASIADYEKAVEDCVVALAEDWNVQGNSLEETTIVTLKNQTRSVLQGESPVIKLLDNRMREVFAELVLTDLPNGVPTNIQTGVQQSGTRPKDSAFATKARLKFQERGLAFYSAPLAYTTELAAKIANLACQIYMDDFLDNMILESLNVDSQ